MHRGHSTNIERIKSDLNLHWILNSLKAEATSHPSVNLQCSAYVWPRVSVKEVDYWKKGKTGMMIMANGLSLLIYFKKYLSSLNSTAFGDYAHA